MALDILTLQARHVGPGNRTHEVWSSVDQLRIFQIEGPGIWAQADTVLEAVRYARQLNNPAVKIEDLFGNKIEWQLHLVDITV
jgi:hypothetical protein